MDIKIGDYQITSDSFQFVVNKIGTVQEGRLTKTENVGKETLKPVAYAVKFEQALSFIPQDTIRNNEDINTILDKLNAIQGDIQTLKEHPQIESNEDISISKEEYANLLESYRKLEILENYGVDNWGGYGDAMTEYEKEYEEIEKEEVEE